MTYKAIKPVINPRFIFQAKFGLSRVPILNGDGHVDYAHQIGIKWADTELLDSHVEKEELSDGSFATTRWATVKVTVCVGETIASGIACVNSRDKFVKQPGFEVSVAETRALKRAIALAANITEATYNPSGMKPTREFVDMPYGRSDSGDDMDDDIPADIKKSPSDIIDADAENFNV